jgi:hypothetical protein
MNMPDTTAPAGSSLLGDWLYALRYWLGGRTGVIVSLVLLAALGLGLGWSWLVAVGIAPLLVAVLPCAAMCALGFCASRLGRRSCASEVDAKAASSGPPSDIQAVTHAPATMHDATPPARPPGAPQWGGPESIDVVELSEPSDERTT